MSILSPTGHTLAHLHQPGHTPTIVFLPGFASDMRGAKAEYLAAWCAARAQSLLRFDYSGHGQSEGTFTNGTIGTWTTDALAAIDTAPPGDIILIGSSMGGWIALLAALARPRVTALILLAPAPDFTEDLMWQALAPTEQATLLRDGMLTQPSEYGPALTITRALIEDGRTHLLLRAPIPLTLPVRILHGQQDADVPWERSLTLVQKLASTDVELTLVKTADHRLSSPTDLALIGIMLEKLLAKCGHMG